jgi:hypothetical protein
MVEDVKTTHFKVTGPLTDESDPKMVLLRNSSPGTDPGGISAVTLLVAVSESDLWPEVGAYTKTAAMKAAEVALLQLVQKWT